MPAATALLVTRDEVLLDDLLRLAAAAGVVLDVAHDDAAALRSWTSASVVLVGADQLSAVAGRHPVRRQQVHVVARGEVPDEVFRSALAIGAEGVAELPAAEGWLVELLTDIADGGARPAMTIGVVGGSGGVGATTFTTALAITAGHDDRPAILIDADPLGGGIDRVVGLEDQDGIRWEQLGRDGGRFSSRSLRDALPKRDGLAVLTWSATPTRDSVDVAVREVLSAAQRGHDTVLVDLPRYPDPVATEVVSRCDHIILVAGLTVPAVAAASRVAAQLQESARRLHLVARGRPAALDAEEVAAALAVPLLTTVGHQRRLAESVELGLGPVHSRRSPLARAARTVMRALGDYSASAA
jgi:secretion/DNA translocation related CpaE-like protein